MNTDYGFFHLFRALESLRHNKNRSRFCEPPSEVEKELPQINYSVLMSLPTNQQRYEKHPFGQERFEVGLAACAQCSDYNS